MQSTPSNYLFVMNLNASSNIIHNQTKNMITIFRCGSWAGIQMAWIDILLIAIRFFESDGVSQRTKLVAF